MAGDGKNTDDITIPMLFLFNKEGNIILDAIREYEAVEVLLSDKAKDRGKVRGDLCKSSSICAMALWKINRNDLHCSPGVLWLSV